MISPTRKKIMRMKNAVMVPFKAIRPLSSAAKCSTIDKYTGVSPMGLTRVNSVENARMKKVVISFITFFPVHVFQVQKDH